MSEQLKRTIQQKIDKKTKRESLLRRFESAKQLDAVKRKAALERLRLDVNLAINARKTEELKKLPSTITVKYGGIPLTLSFGTVQNSASANENPYRLAQPSYFKVYVQLKKGRSPQYSFLSKRTVSGAAFEQAVKQNAYVRETLVKNFLEEKLTSEKKDAYNRGSNYLNYKGNFYTIHVDTQGNIEIQLVGRKINGSARHRLKVQLQDVQKNGLKAFDRAIAVIETHFKKPQNRHYARFLRRQKKYGYTAQQSADMTYTKKSALDVPGKKIRTIPTPSISVSVPPIAPVKPTIAPVETPVAQGLRPLPVHQQSSVNLTFEPGRYTGKRSAPLKMPRLRTAPKKRTNPETAFWAPYENMLHTRVPQHPKFQEVIAFSDKPYSLLQKALFKKLKELLAANRDGAEKPEAYRCYITAQHDIIFYTNVNFQSRPLFRVYRSASNRENYTRHAKFTDWVTPRGKKDAFTNDKGEKVQFDDVQWFSGEIMSALQPETFKWRKGKAYTKPIEGLKRQRDANKRFLARFT